VFELPHDSDAQLLEVEEGENDQEGKQTGMYNELLFVPFF
jgi:hypothetical protein